MYISYDIIHKYPKIKRWGIFMKNVVDNMKIFESKARNYHIPRWEELPDFDLYMDQILNFLEKNTEIFGISETEKIITNSMINNYVKLGLIKAPIKKKYNKNHIANLLMITILKKVLSMNEIKEVIFQYNSNMGEAGSYNYFCDELEKSLLIELDELKTPTPVIRLATKSLSSKIAAELLIKQEKQI